MGAELFISKDQALKAVLQKASGDTTYEVPWFQKGVSNVFIARVLTNCDGSIATDQDISQWKNDSLQLSLMDIYVTLAYK